MAGKRDFKDKIRELINRSAPKSNRRPPPARKGGSEPVTVEPNRPKLGAGGAAVALEFDS